ncbi:MAG: hypothetical protein LBD55_08030 [Treponema sp.]|jgi:hypothetical protein|nr:hypothetical protein [Treponema sp.]
MSTLSKAAGRALLLAAILGFSSCEEYFSSITPDPEKAVTPSVPGTETPPNGSDPNAGGDGSGLDVVITW